MFCWVWTDKCLFSKTWYLIIKVIWSFHYCKTSNLNFNVQLFWKSKNHFVLCFTSQLRCKNKNQNFISNFAFQFIGKKKRNGTLGTRIVTQLNQKMRLVMEKKFVWTLFLNFGFEDCTVIVETAKYGPLSKYFFRRTQQHGGWKRLQSNNKLL